MVAAVGNGVVPMDQTPGPGAIVPVGPAKSVLPTPSLAGLKLETQTRAIGVIQPPPDIRAIVDKTAQFVAKNGAYSVALDQATAGSCSMHEIVHCLQEPNLRAES